MRLGSFPDKALPSYDSKTVSHNAELQSSLYEGDQDNNSIINEQRLRNLIDHGNKVLQRLDTKLQWSVNEKSNQLFVKVVDTQTNEILREIPPEKYLELVQNLCEQVGLFLDERK
ncbi:flagellar protein FlaG [Paenibacillus sp. FSL K6-1230]|uniref:flagellar protein FlaG n=1 Tax=Paenibacillus sp. FSL K6-1230 TaxID=2921603 RepID=UPI0030FB3D86